MGTARAEIAVYSLKINRKQLDRFGEIAADENRTVAQKFRQMVQEEIAAHDEREEVSA